MVIQSHNFEPLPPYTDPRVALRMALPALRPAEQMSVTDAAEKYMRVRVADQWQSFRRDVAPYMVEPTDMIASRKFRGLVFCGPSQSGKTMMLQGAACHAIMCDPGRIALFQMTRDAAAEFERNKWAPMVRNSPELRKRQATGRGSDNINQKLFVGGTQLTLDWPTITKLSSATIRLVLGTDYDHFPDSIGGEGDAFSMMRARTTTYGSRGMVVVESSPGAPIKDESWKPRTPHDAPPVKYGVLALYPDGTRGRWYWPCPHCEDPFEPTFKRLRYPDSDDPAEAGEAAEMVCPHCGVTFGHHLKRELNLAGRWLHESSDGRVVPLDCGDVRKSDFLSYWLDGAAAAFSSWADLVSGFEEAVAHFERTGDEEKLKTALNTGQAQPFVPRVALDENEISLQALKDKQSGAGIETAKGIAPAWTKFLTVSVDTQGNRFDVGVTAWGDDGRHQPVDRFELHTPPDNAPDQADRTVRPFDIAEDWDVLIPLADRVWPVEAQGWGLRPAIIAVDMQGGGSTTENAYRFYRGRRRSGQMRLWYLTRGRGRPSPNRDWPDRIWLKEPERASQRARKRQAATDIRILNMATDRQKDAVSSSLRRTDDGRNVCHLPGWMTEAQLIEMTAERRTLSGWDKRPGMVRNESLDHLVQARALQILIGGEKINSNDPPAWARGYVGNTNAVALQGQMASDGPSRGADRSDHIPATIDFLRG
ncbi:MAG: phage terminase large subunit family protein [Marinibacterium sp.]